MASETSASRLAGGPGDFSLVVLSTRPVRAAARLMLRIQREAAPARVCGLVYRPPPAQRGLRVVGRWLRNGLRESGSLLLRLLHACPSLPKGPRPTTLRGLEALCKGLGCSLLVTQNASGREAVGLICSLRPELVVLHGLTESLQNELPSPPRGSLWVQSHVGHGNSVTAPRMTVELMVYQPGKDGGCSRSICHAEIPVEQLDTQRSLALKQQLLENDLLVRGVKGLGSSGERGRRPAQGEGLDSRSERGDCGYFEGKRGVSRGKYRPLRGRPRWKLLVRSVAFAPLALARNWIRRVRGSFPVIILYHHLISDRPHHMGMPTEHFLAHVQFLCKHYRLASLREAVEMLRARRVVAPTVVLTFDDGYQDNFLNLRAVAEETDMPCALLVCTENAATGRGFAHDLRRGVQGFLPLTWEQIRRLKESGFEIGSHTRSHFDCGSTDAAALHREIVGSKEELESQLASEVELFSFPWGHPAHMSPEAVELTKKTYPIVLSSLGGGNFPPRDGKLWHLRRWSHCSSLWELELLLQEVLEFGREDLAQNS